MKVEYKVHFWEKGGVCDLIMFGVAVASVICMFRL